MSIWLLIPARGGSKGIPGKNLRLLAGKPLIKHVLEALGDTFSPDQIIVSTDSDTIAHVAKPHAVVHERSGDLAGDKTTLDEVAVNVATWLLERGASQDDILITVQPTSPFITAASIEKAVCHLRNGATSVISVRDDRHLRWTSNASGEAVPLFEKRVNRQWLPATFTETGGVIGTTLKTILTVGTRIHPPVALLELDDREGLDIDSYADWAVAEFFASRKRILIRADSKPDIGMGHVHRAVALAHEFAEHNVSIVARADGAYSLGASFLKRHPYPLIEVESEAAFFDLLEAQRPDIMVMDILDTEEAYMRRVKEHSGFVVALEDLGEGARLADIVINDLYTDLYPQHNHWYGVQNAILSSYFETVQPHPEPQGQVKRILVTFGGTDPENLTAKALRALQQLKYDGYVHVILGPGYQHGEVSLAEYGLQGELQRAVKNMALVMQQADLAITSGGRTVTELMTLGVPTIVCCQNTRELRHTHASSPFGVINLGLGRYLKPEGLAEHIRLLLENEAVRTDMRTRALQAVSQRSNRNIVERILEAATASSGIHVKARL